MGDFSQQWIVWGVWFEPAIFGDEWDGNRDNCFGYFVALLIVLSNAMLWSDGWWRTI